MKSDSRQCRFSRPFVVHLECDQPWASEACMLRALLSATRSAKQDDPWDLAGRVARLEAAHRANYEQPDLLLVRRAYRIAEQMHRGQARKSGEPYITHPIAVATILAELGVDTATIAAGLLHDTVEDTS